MDLLKSLSQFLWNLIHPETDYLDADWYHKEKEDG